MKYFFTLLFNLILLVGYSQVPTKPYYTRSAATINYINECNYGKTSYQVDKSINSYYLNQNGYNYVVYYYYIWFFNDSYKDCQESSTYIQSINIWVDGQYIGNYYLLITGDYYYLTIWSVNPKANIRVEYSQPLPY
jgi:hypothetical protein